MKLRHWFVVLAIAFMPVAANATGDYELMIPDGGIRVDADPVMVNQTVKVYVTIKNIGHLDNEGIAVFMDNGSNFSMKDFSAKINGNMEEIWSTWTPKTAGSHTVKIKLVPDASMNNPALANYSSQITVYVDQDTDGDGIRDQLDPDIDNDGLTNDEEHAIGTDPYKPDTDGDGVNDKNDYYPLDPSRWKKEVAPVVVTTQQTSNNNQGQSQTNTTSPKSTGKTTPTTPSRAAASPPDQATTNENDQTRLLALASTSTDLAIIQPTSTAEIITPTTTEIVTTTAANDGTITPTQPASDKETKNSFWNLNTFLWSIAALCGLVAGIFTWLAIKKKNRQIP
jgi:hypothetical protein